jgi:7,8-dihydropterin-6-yl-methyl-4-(beta-D-ribofuranosyl)aminobenzene 5'-phosphate synthase
VSQALRVTCVVDDAAERGSPFLKEHGLSLLIEKGGQRVLFDTGQSETVLLHNLEQLDINPVTIDAVAISHAHYDHTGGLPALLDRLDAGTPLYAHPDLFRPRFSWQKGGLQLEEPQDVGLALNQEALARRLTMQLGVEPQEILPGLWTTGEISERPEREGKSPYHLMQEGDALVVDAYRDDMALVLDLGEHMALLCGCCHAGLLNTVAHVQRTFGWPIALMAGGLHLTSASPEDLQQICEVLAAMPALQHIYPNHCTGEAAIVALTQKLGPSVVHPFTAGSVCLPGG